MLLKRIISDIIKHTHSERLVSLLRYYAKFKKMPNLHEPKTINEKILWLEFNTDTSLWSTLSDKHAVREYVKNKGLEDLLVKQYGYYYNAEDIDFDILPDKFVIKTNNGCGSVLLIDDKSKVNTKEIRNKLRKWLKEPFGYITGEPHYTRITPCIVIDEFLNIDKSLSSSLVDYKFWCINGKVDSCLLCIDRDLKKHKVVFEKYTVEDWQKHDEDMASPYQGSKFVPKPKNLTDMVKYAEILSEGIPLVRVDFYEVNGKVYFGEMTFTSNGGRMTYYTDSELLRMGSKLVLPQLK